MLHNLPAGDWAKGERGIACQPERVGEFQDSVGKAIDYATALGCTQLNCLAGIAPAGADRDKVRATLRVEPALRRGQARRRGHQGADGADQLVRHSGLLPDPARGRRSTSSRTSGSTNLYLLYDIYHMQRMEGELANTIKANLPRIAHFQLADNPGRNEPGTGEINYRFLFGFLDTIGYDGWIGCEYRPKGKTVDGLGWRAAHGV